MTMTSGVNGPKVQAAVDKVETAAMIATLPGILRAIGKGLFKYGSKAYDAVIEKITGKNNKVDNDKSSGVGAINEGGGSGGKNAVKGVKKTPLRRHKLCGTKGKDASREQNTMFTSDDIIKRDLNKINEGNFIDLGGNMVKVGDNTYGYHGADSVIFPVSGPDFIQLSRSEHKYLKALNTEGSIEGAERRVGRDPSISAEDKKRVSKIWETRCKK